MMKASLLKKALALLVAMPWAAPAPANVPADSFARCLNASISQDDRKLLSRWIFVVTSSYPEVSDLVSVSPVLRENLHQQVARLVERLLYVDCRKETAALIQSGGIEALQAQLTLVGRIAASNIMSDPKVGGELARLTALFDTSELEKMSEEAASAARSARN
jgi:hypothetical protein